MTPTQLRAPVRLSTAVAALMAVQSALGLTLPGQYRDVEWIRATWFGNDAVTLGVAVPLLAGGIVLARRGSLRGLLLWLGLLGYAAYNSAYYMLGAALNVFFPLYVLPCVLSVAALVLTLSRLDAAALAARFHPRTPVRAIGGYFVVVALGLTTVWMGMWAAYAFAGRPTPVEPEAFRLVAALDTSLMVPALGVGGVLLWRRAPWGFLGAAIAGVQGSLYLLVLSVNSLLAILGGRVAAPGELPVWGTLAVLTTAATARLLAGAATRGLERRSAPG